MKPTAPRSWQYLLNPPFKPDLTADAVARALLSEPSRHTWWRRAALLLPAASLLIYAPFAESLDLSGGEVNFSDISAGTTLSQVNFTAATTQVSNLQTLFNTYFSNPSNANYTALKNAIATARNSNLLPTLNFSADTTLNNTNNAHRLNLAANKAGSLNVAAGKTVHWNPGGVNGVSGSALSTAEGSLMALTAEDGGSYSITNMNANTGEGGAIVIGNNATLFVENALIANNTASKGGAFRNGGAYFVNSNFVNNRATSASGSNSNGGIADFGGNILLVDTSFYQNKAGNGGGVFLINGGHITQVVSAGKTSWYAGNLESYNGSTGNANSFNFYSGSGTNANSYRLIVDAGGTMKMLDPMHYLVIEDSNETTLSKEGTGVWQLAGYNNLMDGQGNVHLTINAGTLEFLPAGSQTITLPDKTNFNYQYAGGYLGFNSDDSFALGANGVLLVHAAGAASNAVSGGQQTWSGKIAFDMSGVTTSSTNAILKITPNSVASNGRAGSGGVIVEGGDTLAKGTYTLVSGNLDNSVALGNLYYQNGGSVIAKPVRSTTPGTIMRGLGIDLAHRVLTFGVADSADNTTLTWIGQTNSVWDNNKTSNWRGMISGISVDKFLTNDDVILDSNSTVKSINVTEAVTAKTLTVNDNYTLTGSPVTTTGGTTIAASKTLTIGNGTTSGGLEGNVTVNGVLSFNQAADYTFSGKLSGSGELHQDGVATLTLGNNANSIGKILINKGTLAATSATALSHNLWGIVFGDHPASSNGTVTNALRSFAATPSGNTSAIRTAISTVKAAGTLSTLAAASNSQLVLDASSAAQRVNINALSVGLHAQSGGQLTIRNNTIADDNSAGVFVLNDAGLLVVTADLAEGATNTRVIHINNNKATGGSSAGVLHQTAGNAYIEHAEFINNQGTAGGAMYMGGGNLVLHDVRFANNASGNWGGGIYAPNNGILTVVGGEFTGNTGSKGSAITINGTLNLIDVDFFGNTSVSDTGALIVHSYGGSAGVLNQTVSAGKTSVYAGNTQNGIANAGGLNGTMTFTTEANATLKMLDPFAPYGGSSAAVISKAGAGVWQLAGSNDVGGGSLTVNAGTLELLAAGSENFEQLKTAANTTGKLDYTAATIAAGNGFTLKAGAILLAHGGNSISGGVHTYSGILGFAPVNANVGGSAMLTITASSITSGAAAGSGGVIVEGGDTLAKGAYTLVSGNLDNSVAVGNLYYQNGGSVIAKPVRSTTPGTIMRGLGIDLAHRVLTFGVADSADNTTLTWIGQTNSVWDNNTTSNWRGMISGISLDKFLTNDDVILDSNATVKTINVTGAVTAKTLTVNDNYTLTGSPVTTTGGTTIAASKTLTIGNGTTSGGLEGNVTVNGVLSFNQAADYTFAGKLAGGGQLAQNSVQTLTLNNNQNAIAVVHINKGTVAASSAGALATSLYYVIFGGHAATASQPVVDAIAARATSSSTDTSAIITAVNAARSNGTLSTLATAANAMLTLSASSSTQQKISLGSASAALHAAAGSNFTVSGNDAGTGNGGVFISSGGLLVIIADVASDATNQQLFHFSNNKAASGGVVYQSAGSLYIEHAEFLDNSSTAGGSAIELAGGNAVIKDSSFVNNSGAAAVNSEGTVNLLLINTNFIGNSGGDGGAIRDVGNSSLTLIGGKFVGNTANRDGGAVATAKDTHFTDVSFFGNTAAHWGGGYYQTGGHFYQNVSAGQTSYYAGNTSSLGKDAISFNSTTQYTLDIAAGGKLVMLDPLTRTGSVTIEKTGAGTWQLAEKTDFSGGGTNSITISGGVLELLHSGSQKFAELITSTNADGTCSYAAGEVALASGNTFTIASGAGLLVSYKENESNTISGGTQSYAGAIAFELTGAKVNSTAPLNLKPNAWATGHLAGAGGIRIFGLSDLAFGTYNLIHAPLIGSTVGLVTSGGLYNGNSTTPETGVARSPVPGTRGMALMLSADKAYLQLDVVDATANTTMTWTGTASEDWDVNTHSNWSGTLNGTYPVTRFLNGDDVIFPSGVTRTTVNVASGGVNVKTMQVNADYTFTGAAISASDSITVAAGATLTIGNGSANGSITSAITLSAANSALAFNPYQSYTHAALISGSGNVVKKGSGALTLSNAANAVAGNFTIDAGSVAVNAVEALGVPLARLSFNTASTAVASLSTALSNYVTTPNVTNQTTLDTAYNSDLGNGVLANLKVEAAQSLSFAGNAADGLTVASGKAGSVHAAGTLSLSGYTTVATVNGGFLALTADAADKFTIANSSSTALKATASASLYLNKLQFANNYEAVLLNASEALIRDSSFIQSGALTLQASHLTQSVSANQSSYYLGNSAIAFAGGNNSYNVAVDNGATLKMLAPMRSDGGNNSLHKTGAGLWQLAGNNDLSTGTTTFTISEGRFELLNSGSIQQDGTSYQHAAASLSLNNDDTFTLDSAATLIINGGNTINGGKQSYAGTLSFMMDGAVANSDTTVAPRLILNASSWGNKPGSGKVRVYDYSDLAAGVYTLVDGSAAAATALGTLYLGDADAAYTFERDPGSTALIYGLLQADSGRYLQLSVGQAGANTTLTWSNASANNLWDVNTSANWTGKVNGVPVTKFLTNDSVIFDATTASATAIIVPAAGVTVNAMSVASEHVFTGGRITTTGTLTLAADAVLGISIDPSPMFDVQALSIASGATLNLTGYTKPQNAYPGSPVALITSATAFSDNFTTLSVAGAGASDPPTFLDATLVKSADNKTLSIDAALVWERQADANGTFNVASGTFTLNAPLADNLSGAASGWDGKSLTKTGAGKLILADSYTYSGNTTLSDGYLEISGTLGTAGSAGYTFAGAFANDASLSFEQSDRQTLTGVISGTGSLNQEGNNVLELAANNTFSGDLNIKSGTLIVSGSLQDGAYNGAIVNDGSLRLNTNRDQELSGNISGSGDLQKDGSYQLTLSGSNTYQGKTTINGGTLSIASDANIGMGINTINDDATLLLSGNGATYAKDWVLGSGTINVSPTSISTYGGALSGGGALKKIGSGTLFLTGNSSYSGGTTINQGTLNFNSGAALGTGQVTMYGGVLQWGADSNTVPSVDISDRLILRSSNNFDSNGYNVQLATAINAPGSHLIKTGDGTITLAAGGVLDSLVVQQGGIGIGADQQLVVRNDTRVRDGASISVYLSDQATAVSQPAMLTDSLFIESGAILNVAGYQEDTQADGPRLIHSNNVISGTFIPHLAGEAYADNVQNYMDIALSHTDHDYYLGLELAWYRELTGQLAAHGTFNVADEFSLGKALVDRTDQFNAYQGWDGKSLTKDGEGTLTLSEANTYTGTTSIRKGTLRITGTLGADANYSAAIDNAGTLLMASDSNQTLSGVISGTGALAKSGQGSVTLSGNNTYQGGTHVIAGTLIGNLPDRDALTVDKDAIYDGNAAARTLSVLNGAGTVKNVADLTVESGEFSGTYDSAQHDLIKSGSGRFLMSGVGGYRNTLVNEGTLALASDAALGSGSNTLAAGTTLEFVGSDSSFASLWTFAGANNWQVDDDNHATYTAVIDDGGYGLHKTGTGILTLSAINNGIASLTVAGGTLEISGALGEYADTASGDGEYRYTGSIINNDQLVFNTSANQTLAAALSGTGVLIKRGGKRLEMEQNVDQISVQLEEGELQIARDKQVTATSFIMSNNTTLSLAVSQNNSAISVDTMAIGEPGDPGSNGTTLNIAAINIGDSDMVVKLIESVNQIAGDFQTVTVAGWQPAVDHFLDVDASVGHDGTSYYFQVQTALAWYRDDNMHGLFHVEDGQSFELISDLKERSVADLDNAYADWNGTTLVKTGEGTLMLSGDNDYDLTHIAEGTLIGDLPDDSDLHIEADGAYYGDGVARDLSTLTGSGLVQAVDTLHLDDGNFSGRIDSTNSGGLIKESDGTLVLSGLNSYTGGTTVSGGTLVAAGDQAFAFEAVTMSDQTTLALQGVRHIANDITLNGTVNLTTLPGGQAAAAGGEAQQAQLSGVLSGSGGLVKSGSDFITLSGNNTYQGDTLINAGGLFAASDKAFADGRLTLADQTTLGFVGNRALANPVTLTGAGNFYVATGMSSLNAAIDGSGSLIKQGSGTLTLTRANSYAGETRIEAGTLALQGQGSISSAALTLAANTTFDFAQAAANQIAVAQLNIGGTQTAINAPGKSFNLANSKVNVYLPATIQNGNKLTTVTGNLLLNNTLFNIFYPDGRPSLREGEGVILFATEALNISDLTSLSITALAGDVYTLSQQGNDLWAMLAHSSPTTASEERMKAYSESFITNVAFVNQGQDFIINQGFDAALLQTFGHGLRYAAFGGVGGGRLRHDTGSYTRVKGATTITGVAIGNDVGEHGRWTAGAFLEGGWGDYNTYNSFAGAAAVDGGGDSKYYGTGVLARYEFRNGIYSDASVRFGQAETDFSTSDITYNTSRASFTSKSMYFSSHLGVGYILGLNEKMNFDFNLRGLYTHQQGDKVKVYEDTVKFDAVDSWRLRAGGKLVYHTNNDMKIYAGAYWEREFDGDAFARVNGKPLPTVSLDGETVISEVGLVIAPSPGLPLTINFGAQWHVGDREGLTGSLHVRYEF